jgi:Cu+-exporting ATPase
MVSGTNGSISDLRLVNLAGETVALADHVGKEPLALLLAGTDSLSDRAAGAVQKVYAKRDRGSLKFIAVVMASPNAARGFSKKHGLTFPVLLDSNHQVMAAVSADAWPMVVFLDRSGKVVQSEKIITEETVTEGAIAVSGSEKLVDPVCNMTVTKETAAGTYVYKGQTYYFCSKACKDNFTKDPQKYLAK